MTHVLEDTKLHRESLEHLGKYVIIPVCGEKTDVVYYTGKSMKSHIQPMWLLKAQINTSGFRLKVPIISAASSIIWEGDNITSIRCFILLDVWKNNNNANYV